MIHKNYSIGVIGGGVVGQAVASFFGTVKVYDKFKEMDSFDEVSSQEVVFLCVPTPYANGFDKSALDESFERIAQSGKDPIVVIKSTVVPGTTEQYQKQYAKLRILFSPEFLTDKTAREDFLKPDKQLVGFTEESKLVADDILALLPDAPYKKTLSASAAELVKYGVNTYYATKVIFGNLLYDLSEKLGVSYDEVKEAFVSDQRIFDSHFDVWHGGYRGYGGKCLPKDMRALIDVAREHGVDARMLEAAEARNNELAKEKKEV